MRSLSELEALDNELFKAFHPMPNNAKRAALYKKWIAVRNEINQIIFKGKK